MILEKPLWSSTELPPLTPQPPLPPKVKLPIPNAYGVVDDGASPGQRSGDGAFVTMEVQRP